MAGIVIGIVLAVLSVPLGILIIVLGTANALKPFDSPTVFAADGSINQVSIISGRTMAIWINMPTGGHDCSVADPSGNDVSLRELSVLQDVGTWFEFAQFTPTGRGIYTVTCLTTSGGTQINYTIEPAFTNPFIWFVSGVVAGFVAFAVGLFLIIWFAVRRGKWTNTYGYEPAPVYAQPMPPIQQAPYPGTPYPPQQPSPAGATSTPRRW